MISFKAHYFTNTQVTKINPDNSTSAHRVNIVELEPCSTNDLNTLKETAKLWGGKKDSFAADICEHFDNFFKERELDRRFYAITEQTSKFKKLNPLKILGLMETTPQSSKRLNIDYFEVSPLYAYAFKERTLKGIGRKFFEAIAARFSNKEFMADVSLAAEPFYKKLGFETIRTNRMRYLPKI